MSKLSEQREQEAQGKPKSGPRWLWPVVIVVALGVAWAAYDYFSYTHASTLDKFAKCVSSKGARMYGAWWCPHCANQKEALGYAFQYINYIECGEEGKPHSINERCKQAGIKNFPTWQFADGSRNEGELPITDLSQKTGCKLP